jgi:hypothetical protein
LNGPIVWTMLEAEDMGGSHEVVVASA